MTLHATLSRPIPNRIIYAKTETLGEQKVELQSLQQLALRTNAVERQQPRAYTRTCCNCL